MKYKKLKRYIKKFLNDIKKHDKDFFDLVKLKINNYDQNELVNKIELIIQELNFFGQITKKNLYPLCQCILYGIINNHLTIFSMNSNALIKNEKKLREKPQYMQISNIDNKLKNIENKINIKIEYISILPDFSDDFPLENYDKLWEKNKEYLEFQSHKKAYRLSELYKKDVSILKKEINNSIDLEKLNKIISYYENNKFIVLSFSASPNFQRNQILNYLITGVILENILPFSILLDVQKKYYPFEQKFYNYNRKFKLPIILCGQKY